LNRILADTGPLYALVDPQDRYHEQAREELALLFARQTQVCVLQPTLLEGHSLVLRRLGGSIAQRWMRETSEGLTLLNPDAEDYAAARILTAKYPDQAITLFDALVAVSSSQLGTPVWTYDHHFDILRAEVWRPH
jgi:predicted nucleic acid-binding protein